MVQFLGVQGFAAIESVSRLVKIGTHRADSAFSIQPKLPFECQNEFFL